MIQRIQSVYLFVTIVLLVVASFVGNFFELATNEGLYYFNGSGIDKWTLDRGNLISSTSMPVMVVLLVIAAFAALVLFSYKNLAKQFKYARLLWGFYVIALAAVVIWYYFLAQQQVSSAIFHRNFGASFYILVIGLPFVNLAFLGIKKDKATIDSLNRLR